MFILIRFVADCLQKYVRLLKFIEGEASEAKSVKLFNKPYFR